MGPKAGRRLRWVVLVFMHWFLLQDSSESKLRTGSAAPS